MKFKEVFVFGATTFPGLITCFSFVFVILERRKEAEGGNRLYYVVCGVSFVYAMVHIVFMLVTLRKTVVYEKWTKHLMALNYAGEYEPKFNG